MGGSKSSRDKSELVLKFICVRDTPTMASRTSELYVPSSLLLCPSFSLSLLVYFASVRICITLSEDNHVLILTCAQLSK